MAVAAVSAGDPPAVLAGVHPGRARLGRISGVPLTSRGQKTPVCVLDAPAVEPGVEAAERPGVGRDERVPAGLDRSPLFKKMSYYAYFAEVEHRFRGMGHIAGPQTGHSLAVQMRPGWTGLSRPMVDDEPVAEHANRGQVLLHR